MNQNQTLALFGLGDINVDAKLSEVSRPAVQAASQSHDPLSVWMGLGISHIEAGGLGSGCRGSECGRPKGSGTSKSDKPVSKSYIKSLEKEHDRVQRQKVRTGEQYSTAALENHFRSIEGLHDKLASVVKSSYGKKALKESMKSLDRARWSFENKEYGEGESDLDNAFMFLHSAILDLKGKSGHVKLNAGGPGSGRRPNPGTEVKKIMQKPWKNQTEEERRKIAHADPRQQSLFKLKSESEMSTKKTFGNYARNKGKKSNAGNSSDYWFKPEPGEKGGVKAFSEPESFVGGSHIEAIPSTHPPSLKNPDYVPSPNDPREEDDRFLDVAKRKQAHKERMKLLKRSAPGGLPPLIPVKTTGVEHHMQVNQPQSLYASRLKSRPFIPGRNRRQGSSVGKVSVAQPAVLANLPKLIHAGNAETLFRGIRISGFSTSQQEAVRALLSRIPPVILARKVKEVISNDLGAIHGQYDPDTNIVEINPKIFSQRIRLGKGPGWLMHWELTIVHEIGHSIYQDMSADLKNEWLQLSNWKKGTGPGQSQPYVEKRLGWPAYTSRWTHKAGLTMPRIYSSKNPNEMFADCFAFVLLGKPGQMAPAAFHFIEKIINQYTKGNYPSKFQTGQEKY